jgi:hypothetical protein
VAALAQAKSLTGQAQTFSNGCKLLVARLDGVDPKAMQVTPSTSSPCLSYTLHNLQTALVVSLFIAHSVWEQDLLIVCRPGCMSTLGDHLVFWGVGGGH